jgi:glycogen(starch) synthase
MRQPVALVLALDVLLPVSAGEVSRNEAMRVLQLGPFPPPHGGVAEHLSALRAALLAHGDTCPVVALARPTGMAIDDADVYRPRSILQLVRMLLDLRCDIVHLHIGGSLTLRLLGLTLLCTLLPGRKSVLTFHSGGYPSSPAGRRGGPMSVRGFIFRRLNRIIGVNAQIIEMFHRFGVPKNKLRLISPYSITGPSPDIVIPEETKVFLQEHWPRMISVGLLEPEYSLKQQIDVLELVREEFPRAGLVLIGSGSLEGDLRARIAEKHYAKHIRLLGDVHHGVTLRVIEECDLMLRTTLYDGDAISVREALHFGLPVIATDNAMRPEGVDVIPAADLETLHAAIKRNLTRGRPQPIEHPDGQANIRAVLQLYHESM